MSGALLWLAGTAVSAFGVSAFLEIPGVEGESTVPGFEGWIMLESFEAGFEVRLSDLTRLRGVAVPETFKASKYYDASSPYLALAASRDRTFPEMQMVTGGVMPGGGFLRVTWNFLDVQVVGYEVSEDPDVRSFELLEDLEFSFEEWGYVYDRPATAQSSELYLEAVWNFADNLGGWVVGPDQFPPQIAPFPLTTVSPGLTYSFAVMLSDEDTPVDSIMLRAESLNPDKVTVLGFEGEGEVRTLRLAVAELFSGTAEVRVRASDGYNSSAQILTLSIGGGATPFEKFLTKSFGDAWETDPSLADPLGDPDLDRLFTIVEFYLGTSAGLFTRRSSAISESTSTDANGTRTLHLQYYRRNDVPSLVGGIQISPDGVNWSDVTPGGSFAYKQEVTPGIGTYDLVKGELTLPAVGLNPYFLRFKLSGSGF